MMDWDHRRRWNRGGCSGQVTSAKIQPTWVVKRTRSQLILPLATYAILLCLVPLVVCREADTEIEDTDVSPLGPRGYADIFSDSEIHNLLHHRKHHHTINAIDDEDASNSIKEWSSGRKRKFRGRSKSTKQPPSPVDNEFDVETLGKQISISSSLSSSEPSSSSQPEQKRANIVNSNLKYLEPDKKYFDYFPIEDVQLNYDPKEDDIRVVLLSADDTDEDLKKKKSKKFATNSSTMKKVTLNQRRKREVDLPGDTNDKTASDVQENDGGAIKKRSAYGRQSTFVEFLESQRSKLSQNAQNYQPSFGYQGSGGNYYTQGTPNDPWNNRFIGPLNNFYLPLPLPFQSSSTPVVTKFPIPGINQNPVIPNGNYLPPQSNGFYPSRPSVVNPPQPQPQPKPETKPGTNGDLNTRFGADDDRVIWDVAGSGRDTTVNRRPERPDSFEPPGISGGPSTRKPPPPLIHRPDRPSGNRDNRISSTTPRSGTGISPAQPDQSLRNKNLSTKTNRNKANTKYQSKEEKRKIEQLKKEIFAPPASNALGNGGFGGNFEPEPPRQTQRPPTPPAQSTTGSRPPPQSGINSPSKCVWGILTCCARSNLAIRYACFEQLGCQGAFWDLNPCSDELQDAALEEARKFFD